MTLRNRGLLHLPALLAALVVTAAVAHLQIADDTVPPEWQSQIVANAGRRANYPNRLAAFRGEFIRNRRAHPPPILLQDVVPHPRLGWPWPYRDLAEMYVYEWSENRDNLGVVRPDRFAARSAVASASICLALVVLSAFAVELLDRRRWRISLRTFFAAIGVVALALAPTPLHAALALNATHNDASTLVVRLVIYFAFAASAYSVCHLAVRAIRSQAS